MKNLKIKKLIQYNLSPSFFYIRDVIVGELLPIIKESLIRFFLFGIVGHFSVDDWNI
jgi:hypothetical protein